MRTPTLRILALAGAVLRVPACDAAGGPSRPSEASSPGPSSPAASATPPTTTPATSSSPSAVESPEDRVAGWRSDLELLVPGMEELHPDLFHGVSRAALEADVARVEAAVPTLDNDQVMTEVVRLAARVGAHGRDGHTGAFVWGTGTYPLHSLPLRLWLFPEGVFVVDALPPYRDLVGARVERVAGHPIDDVLRAIEPLVSRDNDSTVLLVTPRFLLIPEVLHGLGLIDEVGPVPLGLAGRNDAESTVDVEPIEMNEYNAWAGPYGLHLPPRPGPLSLRRSEEPLWDGCSSPARSTSSTTGWSSCTRRRCRSSGGTSAGPASGESSSTSGTTSAGRRTRSRWSPGSSTARTRPAFGSS